jgi:predicted Zn-dependent peptidase
VSASNGTPGTRFPNLFTIFAEPRYPHTNAELEKVISQEIEKLKTEPVSENELIKAKNHLKMDYMKSLDSNSEMASTLSYYEVLLGDFKYFANYIRVIDKVSATDIQNTVKLYFTNENRTVAELNKKKE